MQSTTMRNLSLLLLRVSLAGLLFWWGLAKGLNTGVGQGVSERYYGGLFSIDYLLIAFGWVQVVAAVFLALGLYRYPFLIFQFVINLFVAIAVWQSIIDPFWYWMPGERPGTQNQLFYPSFIIVSGSFLLLTMRSADHWALDRLIGRR
ncbi:hypothetical protein KHP62_07255 [Rhodobacteraceae bacterium NNCM2]|nr:hypothetical protein [Coraliihabitans acroporae]